MTSDSRAVSMTSLVIVLRLLISMMRRVWANRRWTETEVAAGDAGHGRDGFGASMKSSADGVARLSLDQ